MDSKTRPHPTPRDPSAAAEGQPPTEGRQVPLAVSKAETCPKAAHQPMVRTNGWMEQVKSCS